MASSRRLGRGGADTSVLAHSEGGGGRRSTSTVQATQVRWRGQTTEVDHWCSARKAGGEGTPAGVEIDSRPRSRRRRPGGAHGGEVAEDTSRTPGSH
jgi:hypothetical protein